MNNTEKKELYESIMRSVSVIVKKAINEDLTPDKTYKNNYMNQWILFLNLWSHMITYMKEIDNNRKIEKKSVSKKMIDDLIEYLNLQIKGILR